MRKAEIFYKDEPAGLLVEDDDGYTFKYYENYLKKSDSRPVSLTLPLCADEYSSIRLFPFFDGLIPEGWLLSVAERNWKLDSRDRMGLLMACCRDCIGAVSVRPIYE